VSSSQGTRGPERSRAGDGDQGAILHAPLELRAAVQRLPAANGSLMLFDTENRKYTTLGSGAAEVLDLLDGSRSGDAIVTELAQRHHAKKAAIAPRLVIFFEELRQANVLAGLEPSKLAWRRRLAQGLTRIPKVKLTLTRRPGRLVAPSARLLSAVPTPVLGLVAAVLAVVCGEYAVMTAVTMTPVYDLRVLPWAFLLVYVSVFTHEMSHALVCELLDVPARELGVALWYYMLPVFYVDRTDAYRVQSRYGRVAICLAGPGNDLAWAAAAAAVAHYGSGEVALIGQTMLFLLLSLLVTNLNPLWPNDGQQAAEVALGDPNLRGRAMSLVAHLLLRTTLPSNLAAFGRPRRVAYTLYGTLCLLALPLLAVLMGLWAHSLYGLLEHAL
jgi:putative peptide zinc metalloprotease protein